MNISAFILAALIPASAVVQPEPRNAAANTQKASQIIGMVVVDSRNQQVAKVNDLAIDLQAGRVAEVLVDTGGRLTSKQRIVAVPPECFTFTRSKDELHMNADLDAFDAAPEFNVSTWDDSTTPAGVTDVYERFHFRPYSHIGPLMQATRVTGLVARNQHNQHLGKIDDLVVELPTGKIPQVIFASQGFMGMGEDLTAIPPEGFAQTPDSDGLILDTTREALKAAPHFKPDDWRNSVNQSMSLSSTDDSLPNVRSSGNETTNVTTPASQADATITEQIELKILLTDGLSADARHIQVITRGGRVTLRGTADSLKEKKQLGEIAATVVPVDHIDNQVQVKALAMATD